MAALGDLIIRVGANITGLQSGMGTVSKELGKVDREVSKAFSGFDKLGDRLSGLGNVLTAGITVPLGLAAGASTKFAQDFELAMRQVTSLLGGSTQQEFEALKQQTLDLSRSMGIDAVKSAEALYDAISANIPKENAIEFLRVASESAIAGVTDTKVAVNGLTGIINAYGLSVSQAREVGDAMFQAVNVGKFTFDQLANSISIAAPLASNLGVGFKELLATATTLTGTNMSVSEAFTAVKSAIIGIITPNKLMNELLEKTGFASGIALLKAKGFQGALLELTKAAQGNTGVIAEAIGRTEGLQSVLGLTGQNATKAAEHLQLVTNSTGSLNAAFKEIDKARGLERFRNEAKVVAIEFGQALLPALNSALNAFRPMVNVVRELAQWFASLPESTRSGIIAFGAVAAALGPVIFLTGQMISSFSTVSKSLIVLADGFNKTLGKLGLATGSLGLFQAALISVAGYLLVDQVLDSASAFGRLTDSIAAVFPVTTNATKGLVDSKAALGSTADSAKFLKDSWEKLTAALSGFDWKGLLIGPIGLTNEALDKLANLVSFVSGKFPGMDKAVADSSKKLIDLAQTNMKVATSSLEAQASSSKLRGTLTQQDKATLDAARSTNTLTTSQKNAEKSARDLHSAYQTLKLRDVEKEAKDLTAALNLLKKSGDFNKLSAEEQARVTKLVEDAQFAATRQTISLNKEMAALFLNMRSGNQVANEEALRIQSLAGALSQMTEEVTRLRNARLSEELLAQMNSAAQAGAEYAKLRTAAQTLGITLSTDLKKASDDAQKAYETIRDSATATGQDIQQAWLKAIEAHIAYKKSLGENVADMERTLEDFGKKTKDKVVQVKTIWQEFGEALKSIGASAARGLSDIFVGSIFGNKENQRLDAEAAALRASLEERRVEWEKYQQDIAAQMVVLREKHAEELAKQEQDLKDALAAKQAEYNSYAVEVEARIKEISEANAGRAAEEIAELRDSLAERRAAYEEYRSDVYAQIEQLRTQNAAALEQELSDLRDALRDRSQQYEDYVTDVNTKLSRIGADTEDAITDETRQTQRSIADRQKAYDRDEKDTLKRIAELEKEGKSSNKKQIEDLKLSLARKKEDLEEFTRRAQEDLKDFTEEHKLQAERQTADLKAELTRRERDHTEFVADNIASQKEVSDKYKTQLETQTSDLLASLKKREGDLGDYETEVEKKIAAITKKYTDATAAEVADLKASLKARADELDTYKTNVGTKLEAIRAEAAAKLTAAENDLKSSLGKQETEYDNFVTSVTAKLAEIEAAHTTVWGKIKDLIIGENGILGQIATVFSDLAIKTIGGELFGKLKELITMIPGIGEALGGLISKIPGLSTPTVPTVPTVPTTGGAGGAGGLGGLIGSGVSGVLGSVFQGISAVSSVFSAIGTFRLEGTMNAVEENTRYNSLFTLTLIELAHKFWPSIDTTARWAASNGATLQDISNNLMEFVAFPLLQLRDYVSGTAESVLTDIRTIAQQISWDLMDHVAFTLGETRDRINELTRYIVAGNMALAPMAAMAAPIDAGGSQGSPIQINLVVDGRTLATVLANYWDEAGIRT